MRELLAQRTSWNSSFFEPWIGMRSSCPKVISPKIFSQVAQKFIMLSNIITSSSCTSTGSGLFAILGGYVLPKYAGKIIVSITVKTVSKTNWWSQGILKGKKQNFRLRCVLKISSLPTLHYDSQCSIFTVVHSSKTSKKTWQRKVFFPTSPLDA